MKVIDIIDPIRFLKFAIVGTSGVVVNLGTLYIFVKLLSMDKILAGAIAIELSILNNFFWNNMWTWRDRKGESWLIRLLKYNVAMLSTSALGNFVLYAALVKYVGLHYLISQTIGIGVAVLINFFLSDRWVFKAVRIENEKEEKTREVKEL